MVRLRVLLCSTALSTVLAVLAAAGPAAAAPTAPRSLGAPSAQAKPSCSAENTVHAYVVALDQFIYLNRLGASMPQGMMFALANDVFPTGTAPAQTTVANSCRFNQACTAGNVALRPDKRPRPIVLRVNEGDCLDIHFANLLSVSSPNQGITTKAAPHVQGLNWVRGPQDDASFVGNNPSSLVPPASAPLTWTDYLLFAEHEGSYLLYSTADDWTAAPGGADGGQLAQGLFGSVNVQPSGYYPNLQSGLKGTERKGKDWSSEFYRSQVNEQDLCLASADGVPQAAGTCFRKNPATLPTINYQQIYPASNPRHGLPILNMVCSQKLTPQAIAQGVCVDNELVHSDLTAVISGPSTATGQPGAFPYLPDPDQQPPSLRPIYAYPDRLQPYREFTIIYHESYRTTQAFPACFNSLTTLNTAADNFGINYGMGGLSAPVLANRLGVGPVATCTDCKFEEFFLSSWAMGDPAMVVDNPASACVSTTSCTATPTCKKATEGLYPDDPSNVYHSYISDHLRFRVLHGGSDLHHLHHQHAQQWLGTPNSPDGDYLDSQSIGPGSAFTMEMVYNGSGNVNQVVGDSIFHCHFYPHFASGMWSLWRTHDVFEPGTLLDPTTGRPYNPVNPYTHAIEYARALPDGEITAGTPNVALVPLPTLPMAPLPAAVRLQGVCSKNPAVNCFADSDCTAAGGTCGQQGTRYCVMEGKGPAAACISELTATESTWSQVKSDEVLKQGWRNPGYPFFVPGIGGSRAPHPPLDFAYACSISGKICDPTAAATDPLMLNFTASIDRSRPDYRAPIFKGDQAICAPEEGNCAPMDGGLPRSVTALGTSTDWTVPTPPVSYDFSKEIENAQAVEVPEPGTLIEKVAMAAHSVRFHYDSQLPDGTTHGTCSDNQAPCSGNTTAGRWQCANPEKALCSPAGHINFVLNGLAPKPGAPYADPCINFTRNGGQPNNMLFRSYLAVDMQTDALFNKEGWHFPQQRLISLWGDAKDFMDRKKPPEPLFLRVNSYDCMTYVLADLVPNVYELDDFQVRTPTDVLGQHIHLVKFDVTSSDGASNGWNYEDGTFAPNEVTERIRAINHAGGIYEPPSTGGPPGGQHPLTAKFIKFFGPGPGGTFGHNDQDGAWMGSQATIQRWYDDPLYNNSGRCQPPNKADFKKYAADLDIPCTLPNLTASGTCPHDGICAADAGQCSDPVDQVCTQDDLTRCNPHATCEPFKDRTIRTVFTHDHFGPSTHQQAGLYAGVVAEPKGSVWRNNQSGDVMGGFDAATGDNYPGRSSHQNGVTVQDGGPTSWEAVIETPQLGESYREFMLEVQDSTLAYKPFAIGSNPFESRRAGVCTTTDGPCGFCSFTGKCSNDRTKTCTIANNGTSANVSNCGSTGATCLFGLVEGAPLDPNLVACTPTNLTACTSGQSNGQSCDFITGVPAATWQSGGPIDVSNGLEAITFQNATNNFSFNYRNEPLYPRINNPLGNGQPFADWRGDLGYVFSSMRFCVKDPSKTCTLDSQCAAGDVCGERPNPRGKVCSGNLAINCVVDGDCTGAGTCQDAGFCQDSYNLCTIANSSLCGGGTCLVAPESFPYPPLTAGIQPGDPYTPLLRAYAGDDVQVRVLIGAHINPHNFTLHGLNWLTEPSFVDSGWRNSQVMGISEHYNLLLKLDPKFDPPGGAAAAASYQQPLKPWMDYLYQPGAAAIEQASGNWGLIRAYDQTQADLAALPQNNYRSDTKFATAKVCKPDAPVRNYNVVATTAQRATAAGELIYNATQNITQPQGMVFLSLEDPNVKCGTPGDYTTCKYVGKSQVEPLVLRAAAGDCIQVTLYNALPQAAPAWCSATGTTYPNPGLTCPYGTACSAKVNGTTSSGVCQIYGSCSNSPATSCTPEKFPSQCPAVLCKNNRCTNSPQTACTGNDPTPCPLLTCQPLIAPGIASGQLNTPKQTGQTQVPLASATSLQVGLRPQLVIYDPRTSDGTNAGFNSLQTAAPGGKVTYTWYAGHIELGENPGEVDYIPIEFGSANLLPPDPLNQYLSGLFGGLIIEPKGADWHGATGTTADVDYTDVFGMPANFREFVVFTPDDSNNLKIANNPPSTAKLKYNQVNYAAEPLNTTTTAVPPRFCNPSCNAQDVSCVLATTNPNTQVYCKTNGTCAPCDFQPATPTFTVKAGQPMRFRLLHGGGTNTNEVFELYGHTFLQEPNMTPPEACEAPTTQTNLAASQFLGLANLCGSLGFLPKGSPQKHGEEWFASLHEWKASLQGHGPTNHFDVVIEHAGGPMEVCGDYLYRTYPADHFNQGMWGILRVGGCSGSASTGGGGTQNGGK